MRTASIQYSHAFPERDGIMELWNKNESGLQVLVSSYRAAGMSMNLHEDCSDLMKLEPSESAKIALQCIGRVFRIGQSRAPNIWIVTTDHTRYESEGSFGYH
jgi:SNF2 family DNA or RNA helicase